MLKKDVVALFEKDWDHSVRLCPHLLDDKTAKRCAWNDYVDYLYRDKQITDRQANTWVNPFS